MGISIMGSIRGYPCGIHMCISTVDNDTPILPHSNGYGIYIGNPISTVTLNYYPNGRMISYVLALKYVRIIINSHPVARGSFSEFYGNIDS